MNDMYEEILDVAEKLFMTKGYQATSTRQITEILGVSQPTIYYHFKNKEEIYYHVMLRLSEDVRINLGSISENQEKTLEEKLISMTEFLKAKHPFNLFLMLHDIQHTLSPALSKKLYVLWEASYKQPFITLFSKHNNQLRKEMNLEFVVRYLFMLIASYLEKGEQEYELQESIDLFLHGVIKD